VLADVGYDGVLSIEHEDPAMSAVEGVEKSVELLRRVLGAQGEHKPA
jgi:sugar phosphate isomerase/epimerase